MITREQIEMMIRATMNHTLPPYGMKEVQTFTTNHTASKQPLFIANSPADIKYLLAEVKRLEAYLSAHIELECP